MKEFEGFSLCNINTIKLKSIHSSTQNGRKKAISKTVISQAKNFHNITHFLNNAFNLTIKSVNIV